VTQKKSPIVNFLQEFSIPLIAGVFVALAAANLFHDAYHDLLHWKPFGDLEAFGHAVTFHFLVNDVFMVFFFGIAAKEITEAALPGGSLNPIKKAINPLLATVGGVVGPVGVFFALLIPMYQAGAFGEGADLAALRKGWGIPTATDIALAWLVARAVFGAGHPAINFLLLLAVADDAIGLVIIAIFYGDPTNPAAPQWLLLVLAGMVLAFVCRKLKTRSWVPYIFLAGPLAWSGLMLAHLHPALALVFIVPFLPGPKHDTGMFVDAEENIPATASSAQHSPLHNFEHQLKLFVDFGLFFFAFANAGVAFAGIGNMTWIILAALVVGKTVGITLFGVLGKMIGFPLPDRMGVKQLAMAGFVAALGLTVALFVAGAAFGKIDAGLEGQAKMGALFSGLVGVVAIVIGRLVKIRE
jgi:NhaA family Na+:H+ antiporter